MFGEMHIHTCIYLNMYVYRPVCACVVCARVVCARACVPMCVSTCVYTNDC